MSLSIARFEYPKRETYRMIHKIHRFKKINNAWVCCCNMPVEIAAFGEQIRNNKYLQFLAHVLLWFDFGDELIIYQGRGIKFADK